MGRAVAVALIAALSIPSSASLGADAPEPQAPMPDVVMVTWRGCEDACEGFWDYLDSVGLEVTSTTLDAAQERDRIPGLVEQVEALDPDLLVTWGTSVTLGMLGTVANGDETLTADIPAVFMIVADPVGAGIVADATSSGRPLVTGTHNRVPEAVQMRVLADYLPFERVGVVYNEDELNAVLKAEEIRRVGQEQGFEVVERVLALNEDGAPSVDDIPMAVADVASKDVDLIYLGSSSFLRDNADLFTSSALEHQLPVATAYDAMVRESGALIALGSAYYNVGQLAGRQAERVLRDGETPGDLEIVGLDRFGVVINMDVAKELELYPPMLLLRYAEVVGTDT